MMVLCFIAAAGLVVRREYSASWVDKLFFYSTAAALPRPPPFPMYNKFSSPNQKGESNT